MKLTGSSKMLADVTLSQKPHHLRNTHQPAISTKKNEYDKEAIIKDFYMLGDDKVIYVKRL